MTDVMLRDILDCAVKLWMIFFFSHGIPLRAGHRYQKCVSLLLYVGFVMLQRYVLNQWTLSEAFVRNILLYLLTCAVMLAWREGQRQYLIFLASIVFFLEYVWLKLFTPGIFACLHLPTFGYAMNEPFPRVPVTIAESICRILSTVLLRQYAFDVSPDREITGWEALLSLLPALISHITLLILYHLTAVVPTDQSAQIAVYTTLLTLLLVFSMPLLLAATEQRFQLKRRELSLLRMEHQMKAQVLEFERRQLSDAQVRRIYHDLSKQLSVLEELSAGGSDREARTNYLGELVRQAGDIAPQVHTGNAVLDTLLAQKQAQCRAQGITLECMVDFQQADFIRYTDIVTMFSNALDNAIEAVEKVPPEKRLITLSAGVIGGHLIVKCRNPYEGPLARTPDGLFATSKAQPELHGIGLGNLKRIVELYQGVLQIDDSGNTFLVEWMIPVPDRP